MCERKTSRPMRTRASCATDMGESLCERACACLNEHVCEKGEKDDRGPGGTETSVADSTPFSFYYQIIHDKQLWRLAKVRQAG